MNASRVIVVGPLYCSSLARRENDDGTITLEIELDGASQARMDRVSSLKHALVNRVMYRVFRSPRGNIMYLRTPPALLSEEEDDGPYIPPPLVGIVSSPQIGDIPKAGPKVIYMMGVV